MKAQSTILLMLLVGTAISQNKIPVKADSSEANSGIIYGDQHAFMLAAPKGWVLDNSSGVSQGLHAVFYPRGGSWEHSPSVMYANTASKKVKGNETLNKLIAYDVGQYRRNHKSIKIVDAPDISLSNKKTAVVKYFYFSNAEAVAYIDEEKTVVLIVLSSNSSDEFQNSLPAFRKLVESYTFLTSDVQIEN